MNQSSLIALCQRLVRQPGISGQEAATASVVKDFMETAGFDDVWTDRYGSVIGRIRGKGSGFSVLLDGHLDTVPVSSPDAWTHDPFGGDIHDGKLYGRGAADMKGAIAAMLTALSRMIAQGEKPEGDVFFCGSVQEEVFEGIALGEVLNDVKPDCVIIGEASELNLKIGQRGRAEILLEALGKSAHSANPQKGLNAVYEILPAVEAVRSVSLPQHPTLGSAIIELTDIISSPYPGASVVPERCCTTWDRRLLVGETAESVTAGILGQLGKMDIDAKWVHASVVSAVTQCYTGEEIGGIRFFPAWLMEKDHPVVVSAFDALKQAGLPARLDVYSFCTNGSMSAGHMNIPTIGFGPCREDQAHVVDEYILTDELEKAALGYQRIVQSLTQLRKER